MKAGDEVTCPGSCLSVKLELAGEGEVEGEGQRAKKSL